MKIIIEGVDRSGKSSLSKHILEKFPQLNYVHWTADKDQNSKNDYVLNRDERVVGQFTEFLENLDNSKDYLIDRFIYSDYVYGPVYQNFGRPITINEINQIEDKYLEDDTIIIHCQVSNITLNWKLLQEEGKSLMDFDTLARFRINYRDVMKKSLLKVFHFDFTQNSYEEVDNFIQSFQKETSV